MKVENLTSPKGNKVSNQFIITDGQNTTFQSYESEIAKYRYGKLYLFSNMWDYSNTTRKYFKKFINERTLFQYTSKEQWLKEMKDNDLIEVL